MEAVGLANGAYVKKGTWEVIDGQRLDNVQTNFRAYDTIEHCFWDQDVLFSFSRYKDVRESKTAEDQTVALYRCGYATDPDYYRKLQSILDRYDLKRFDVEKEMVDVKLPEIQRAANVVIDNEKHDAYLIDNTTYVPLRFVTEQLGGVVEKWDNESKTAYIKKGGK